MSLTDDPQASTAARRPRRRTRLLIALRRLHLYTGLLLLPWVLLYGITGAMFNHAGLFPMVSFRDIPPEVTDQAGFDRFPDAEQLSDIVVKAIRDENPGTEVVRDANHTPEYVNNAAFRTEKEGRVYRVILDPVDRSSYVVIRDQPETKEDLLPQTKNLRLNPNPYDQAGDAAQAALAHLELGDDMGVRPDGWCKLNFLATIDGTPARVTYVLRDGHVDITRYDGTSGIPPRQFLMRLHTAHGQPPHWNARMYWSLFADVMAAAMVTWAVTGLIMWWQIKRTRILGTVCLLISIVAAAAMYAGMEHFWATSQL